MIERVPGLSQIFISYRRDDSISQSRQIQDALQRIGGQDSVFMDTRSIQAGDDWTGEIRSALLDADIVIVVVKDWDRWLGVEKYGKKRIDQSDDWIRQELALAFQEKKKVFLVLIGKGEEIVPADVLPGELQQLVRIQAITLRDKNWDHDLLQLVRAVYPESDPTSDKLHPPTPSEAEIAKHCEAALRDYGQQCLVDWEDLRPQRFVEPYLAIRREDQIQDRSETVAADAGRGNHQPLLTDDEKARVDDEMAVQQYRRLFDLADGRGSRICITEDAGAGKSVFTQNLLAVLASETGQDVLFGGRPCLVARWEGRERTWPFNVRQALEDALLDHCAAHGVDGETGRRLRD